MSLSWHGTAVPCSLAYPPVNKDIAALLNLSLYTVETHRRNLQDKLNLHSFAELILYAVRKRVIS